MTAGDKMHARMERHRQMQQERRSHPEVPYSGPWAQNVVQRDTSNLAGKIRADVERRQRIDLDDEEDGTDDDTSMSSSSPATSTASARSEYRRLAAARMTLCMPTNIAIHLLISVYSYFVAQFFANHVLVLCSCQQDRGLFF